MCIAKRKDLLLTELILSFDHHDTIEAVTNPGYWPRYRYLLEQNLQLTRCCFSSVQFEVAKVECNSVARDIVKSLMRDGIFQSYLALGGPAWLHGRLHREATGGSH
ncbi:hypothetical protein N665_0516s0005 [Sinapis alba]|nr:hypothetical protein N665_0516s0004 [Sinapis alba]KAF8089147.1 hypothetical protein N665_0516s0005 [Sinapis alba]